MTKSWIDFFSMTFHNLSASAVALGQILESKFSDDISSAHIAPKFEKNTNLINKEKKKIFLLYILL